MKELTHVIPYRENNSVKAFVAPAVIAVDDDSLPTTHPLGAYLARLGMGSRETMHRGLASALCVMGEGLQLAEVSYETGRFYHRELGCHSSGTKQNRVGRYHFVCIQRGLAKLPHNRTPLVNHLP